MAVLVTVALPVLACVMLTCAGATDPNGTHPVVLVPGVGGSMMHAQFDKHHSNSSEFLPSWRVWIDALKPSVELEFLQPLFDPSSNITKTVFPNVNIFVPQDDYGLFAIDTMDPELPVITEYMHPIIKAFKSAGLKPGTTLFGYPYDWRQSTASNSTVEGLKTRILEAYVAAGNQTVDVVSHSLGGLVVRSFMALETEFAAMHVRNWVALACPWQGGAGADTIAGFLNGYNLQNPMVTGFAAHQVELQCPSFYEVFPRNTSAVAAWDLAPTIKFCSQEEFNTTLVGTEAIDFLAQANRFNNVTIDKISHPLTFSQDIWDLSWDVWRLWESLLDRWPASVQYVGIAGQGQPTFNSVAYDGCITDPAELLGVEYNEAEAGDGDGTVPIASAHGDFVSGAVHLLVNATHHGMLNNPGVHKMLIDILHLA